MTDLEKLQQSFNNSQSPCIYQALSDTSHFTMKYVDQIPKAIENKYHSLKDKLLVDALVKQVWNHTR